MNQEDPIRKCNKCKNYKSKKMFYRYQYCKRCHIKDFINNNLLSARIANRLDISIDELNNILKENVNDSSRNYIGEHERYDEVMLLMTGWNMPLSTVITDNIINQFLDE